MRCRSPVSATGLPGGPSLHVLWPRAEKLWSRSEKVEIQKLLTRLALYDGTIDGKFGQASRDAIHAFQIQTRDFPADGIGRADLLTRLRSSVAGGERPAPADVKR